MHVVMLIDFGSTYTKVTAVDLDNESIIGTSKAFTTIDTDINEGLNNAIDKLQLTLSESDTYEMLACSSAAGGLKMVAIGLVPDLTAEAAKRAALSAGAKVMKVYSYELNEEEAIEIEKLLPDIVLLTGGTDGGNKNVILHNAKMIAAIEGDFSVVVAGNKSVMKDVERILKAGNKEVELCENVLPDLGVLNIAPAHQLIRSIFLKKIVQAKGLTKVEKLIQGILMPTPSAVLNAATLLADGTSNESGLGEILVVDVGGATTDVHSIGDGLPKKTGVLLKDLQEPYAKRTVEGDLGVRYSVEALIEACRLEELLIESNLSKEQVEDYIHLINREPGILSDDDELLTELDNGLTALAVGTAVHRHSGVLETHYTPYGATYLQRGKDLTGVKGIIGTGGPIIHSKNPYNILKTTLFNEIEPTVLKPMEPTLYLDEKYILAAMGLLAEKYPDTALRIMKKELKILES